MNLYEMKKNTRCFIEGVPNNQLLSIFGIRPGCEICVLTRQPFHGPIVVKHKHRNIAIDKHFALNIDVRLVN
ncbi:ferrous iron transport protein A [Natronobacillus azotifigens]|uniref:FeoA family protein n=1 Tax=Natronobacillus azotifigens TaxID=472978 RepID=A0A9J6R7Z9_9BACI|nr:FeoA family protein [Natronobacillus azotifigens]MCZ0701749.1 FeoA family protein [Natronobacillus azotifigens]